MKYGKLTFGQMEALVNNLGGMSAVEDILKGKRKFQFIITESEQLVVTVDYNMSLKSMIWAGEYNQCFPGYIFTEPFLVEGSGTKEVNLHLVHLNQVATQRQVLAQLDKLGLKPAKIEHLLALGAKYPELQLAFPIAAICTVRNNWWLFRGKPYYLAACLRSFHGPGGNKWRSIGTFDASGPTWNEGWPPEYRFLAIEK
jgi:hypothetical protein